MWNLKHSGNPVHSCQTPGAVGRIKWRPGSGAMMAASFSTVNSSVHVWCVPQHLVHREGVTLRRDRDLQHPNIPAYGLDKGGDVATGIVWLQDTPSHLLLASKDGSMGVYRVRVLGLCVAVAIDGAPGTGGCVSQLPPRTHCWTNVEYRRGAGGAERRDRSCEIRLVRYFRPLTHLAVIAR